MASTCSVFSVATFGKRLTKKGAAPIRIVNVRMLDCLAALPHRLRILVEPLIGLPP